ALKVAADRHAHHKRAFRLAVRTPARNGDLIPDLMKRREDVVEELYLDDGLKVADRHTDRASDDVRFGKRRVKDTCRAEFPLKNRRHPKAAALTLKVVEILFQRRVDNVVAEDDDTRVTLHFLEETEVNAIAHRDRIPGQFRSCFHTKKLAVRRVDDRRI